MWASAFVVGRTERGAYANAYNPFCTKIMQLKVANVTQSCQELDCVKQTKNFAITKATKSLKGN